MFDMNLRNTTRSLFKELPYFGVNFIPIHGQFNNSIPDSFPTKKSLEKLSSFHDIDLFSLNTDSCINPDSNFPNLTIRSRYFSPHSFHVMKNRFIDTPKDNSTFSLFHNNVRSLKRNFESLQTHLLSELEYPFSVIGITETRITNSDTPDHLPSLPGYEFEFVPTPLSAGGVGIFINNTFKYRIIEKTSTNAFQALWIELLFEKKSNIICGIIYRQHNSPESFQAYFNEALESFSLSDKAVYVMGDFNINLLNAETCNYTKDFLLALQSYSFIPTIDKPTRVYNTSATLIDNIFVNKNYEKITSGNIISDISDHYSQFCFVESSCEKNFPKRTMIRDFSRFSEEDFNTELAQVDWDSILARTQDNVDVGFSKVYNKLNKLVNKHAPLKPLSKRKYKQFMKPWITKGLLKSIKVKNALFASGDIDKYKFYRNKIITLTRHSKKLHYQAYFTQNMNNMKKTWVGINQVMNRNKRNSKPITALKRLNSNQVTYNPAELPNVLNDFFSSVGQKLASKVPDSNRHFSEYLTNVNCAHSFFFEPVTSLEIELEISLLPSNKAYGLYSCPVRVLKCAKNIISSLLAEMMNISVQTGKYPSKLKHAKVIPVYKCDDETDPSNYRPISLLSIFNRIFEKIMYSRLKSYVEQNELLYKAQYGFREKFSTQHAILDIVNSIQMNMDKKMFSCGIFLDFKKAFDTVDHSILLDKLYFYGIRGIVHDWFSSYLADRTQTTQIDNNHISSKRNSVTGVPQGSVLGPLLFLIYINDIYTCSNNLSFYLFADDTNLLYADRNLKSLETVVNNELQNVCDWLNANKLTINAKKSNFVIFRPVQKRLNYQPRLRVLDNNSNGFTFLECKDYVKFLGVLIDKNLSWKYHIDHIASKISKIVGIIGRLRHHVPLNTLLQIYRSLIFPYTLYGISVWGQAAQCDLRKILILQKRALRLIFFSSNRCHAIPLFVSSNILPVDMLYFETVSTVMHDISTNSAPRNICDLFTRSSNVHLYNTRFSAAQNLYVNAVRLNVNLKSFSSFGTRLWNCLHPDWRKLTKRRFKRQIHKLLLSVLGIEDDYVDAYSLISKLINHNYCIF